MSSPTPDDFAKKAAQAHQRAKRSRYVMRTAVATGVLLTIVFVVQSIWYRPKRAEEPVMTPPKASIISGGQSNFSGIDEHSKPFSVTAQEGVQDEKNEALMHLKGVTGKFIRKQGGDVQVKGDTAEYETRSKDLNIKGNVIFEEPGRYVAHLNSAQVNLHKQIITTKEPVQVETAGATVRADQMETTEDGQQVILKGHVKAHFKEDGTNQ